MSEHSDAPRPYHNRAGRGYQSTGRLFASMDFKKFAKSTNSISSLDYKLLKGMEIAFQGHQLKFLKGDDVSTLFSWRNIASSSLPDHPLCGQEEDPFLTSTGEPSTAQP